MNPGYGCHVSAHTVVTTSASPEVGKLLPKSPKLYGHTWERVTRPLIARVLVLEWILRRYNLLVNIQSS